MLNKFMFDVFSVCHSLGWVTGISVFIFLVIYLFFRKFQIFEYVKIFKEYLYG